MAVYDDQKTDESTDLNELTGISNAEEKAMDVRAADTDTVMPGDIAKAESVGDDKLGLGFNDNNKESRKAFRGFFKKKSTWAVIGVGGGGAGLLIGGFMGLLPLKLISTMSTIQDAAFSNVEAASGSMGENLFRYYLVKQVIPGLDGACTQTNISRSCARFADGDSPIAQLYNAWRDANLEGKMSSAEGGKIAIEKRGSSYFMRATGVPEIDLGPRGGSELEIRTFNDNVYAQMSRNEIRQVVKARLNDTTYAKSMLYKYRVGSLLKKKYGIHRTALSNWLADKTDARRTAAKTAVIARVVAPVNEAFAVALSCSFSGFDCTSIDSTDADGRKMTKAEVDLRARYAKLSAELGSAKLDKLNTSIETIRTKGMYGALLAKLPGEVLPKAAGKFIPIYGWVDAGIVVGGAAVTVGSSLQALSYMMNSSAMVQLFSLYSTAADEQKMGDVDMEALGSFAESLDATEGVEFSAPASSSLLYKTVMEGTDVVGSSTASIFTGSASADTTPLCEGADSRPLAGEYVCEIEKLDANGAREGYINTVGTAAPITDVIVDVWNNTLGFPLRALETLIGGVLGGVGDIAWDTLPQELKTVIEDGTNWLTNEMIPSPFMLLGGDANYGSRTFNMLYGGGVVAANDTAQYGLGGQVLSPEVAAANDALLAEETAYKLASRSLSERLFDKTSQHSFVSRVALALPSDAMTGTRQIASLLTAPLKSIGSAFSSLFANKVDAATSVPRGAAFGIPDFGWDLSSPVFSADPEATWNELGCNDMAATVQAWSDRMVLNTATQQYESRDTNPCKLLESAIESYGGMFSEDLIND